MPGRRRDFLLRSILVALSVFIYFHTDLTAQVISNNGAAINVTTGTVVNSKDAVNSVGILTNSGTINLSGNYTSTANTIGSTGTFRIGGNWTNTGGSFNAGSSLVIFNGTGNQTITRMTGETFFNLSIENTGINPANRLGLSNNVTVLGTLSMSTGNIDPGLFKLLLSNPLASSLNYTSVTGSRILGKFERGVGEAAAYLFPLGTPSYYNPANIITNTLPASGTILSEFLTPAFVDSAGLPLPDPPDEVANAYQDGLWSFTSNGFSSSDFSINLDGTGFITYPIHDITRVLKRTTSTGDWVLDGTHSPAVGNIVARDNLTGDISSSGTQFTLGRARPLILRHPRDTIVCEDAYPEFEVEASSTRDLTYTWYKEPGILLTGPHYHIAGMSTLIINGTLLSDSGYYYCVVTDDYGNSTRSNSAHLTVNKIPVATATPAIQGHECSYIPFSDIILGETYGVPGTTYIWSRDNPAGIVTTIPMSGSVANIGDFLSGSFENTTNDPITVTFSITPVGPAPTYCTGLTVYATVTVNPVPKVEPVVASDDICDNRNGQISLNTTGITLETPTHMTQGVIRFDYTVSVTGSPGDVVGNTSPASDLTPGHTIAYTYNNYTDTIQSVFYVVTPKVVGLGCNPGLVVTPEIRIHAKPIQRLEIPKQLTCEGGSDATLEAIISKGADEYDIIWDGPFGYHSEGSTIISNLGGGRYDLRVTDNIGCTATTDTIVQGAYIDTYIAVTKDVTCPGYSDGEVRVRVNDATTGLPPFEYWLVRDIQDTVAHSTLNTVNFFNYHSGLSAGSYRLHLSDINGCQDTISEATIVQPDMISVSFGKQDYNGYEISCKGYSDGHVWISSISGGNGGYIYEWFTYTGTITGDNTLDRLDDIPAGRYYLRITDALGCQALDSVDINEPDGMQLDNSELSLSRDGNFNVSCFDGEDGSISLTVSGGSGTYSYSWSGPDSYSASESDISGLKAGTYICTVLDANGCELRLPPTSTLPTFTLTEPTQLNIAASESVSTDGSYNINCNGGTGSVDLTVTGGSIGNYNYAWSTADGGGIVPGLEDQEALSEGTYNVVVTDSNLCVISTDVTLTEPDPLEITLVPTHITCQSGGFDNGSVDLTVSGGMGPYTFIWSDGSTTEDISGLTEGNYIVTVTDFNGCMITDSIRINLPPPLDYNATLSSYNGFNISCYGQSDGSISIEPVSGEAPFIYDWTGPDGFVSSEQNLSDLIPGQYNLLITDLNMCTATGVFTLTDPGKLGMNITMSESITGEHNINCAGDRTGTIDIEPVNAAGDVSYIWSDGLTAGSRNNLPAGTYQVIIIDQNNCQADTLMTLTEPDSIRIVFNVTQAFCPDSPDGSISINVTGGVPAAGYIYNWSDNSTGQNISDILGGLYKVTIRDANNCAVSDSVLMEPLHETCLVIPNAITPNGDNINDIWNIDNVDLYPQMEVRVFNRWGTMLWRSEKGYPQPWDGRSNGNLLPIDSYFYIIDLHNGSRPMAGNITIMR